MLELTRCTDRLIEQEDNLVCAEARGAEKQQICTTIASGNSLRCFSNWMYPCYSFCIHVKSVWINWRQTNLVCNKIICCLICSHVCPIFFMCCLIGYSTPIWCILNAICFLIFSKQMSMIWRNFFVPLRYRLPKSTSGAGPSIFWHGS